MNDLEPVLLFVGALALMALSWKYLPRSSGRPYGRGRSAVPELMEEAFDKYLFKVSGGSVPGANLIVIDKQPAPAHAYGKMGPGVEGAGPTWYCMGPGPSYLVIRAVYQMEWHGPRIEFAIRNPEADKFREMLEGQEAALDKVAAVEQAMTQGLVGNAREP